MSGSLANAWTTANAALVEGESASTNFRLKNCAGLFHALHDNADALLDALEKDGSPSAARPRQSAELAAVLATISATYKQIGRPGAIKKLIGHSNLEVPGGVVLVVGCVAHPFASLAIPLSQVIKDGNSAVLVAAPEARNFYALLSRLAYSTGVEKRAFPIITPENFAGLISESTEETHFAAVFAPDTLAKSQWHKILADRHEIYPIGPCPIIIDQTILDGSRDFAPAFAHESDTIQNSKIPTSISKVARNIATARATLGNLSAKSSTWMTSACPSYLLVHEAILPAFMRALSIEFKAIDSPVTARSHSTEAAKDIITGTLPGALDHLPVFSVTSLDYAVDFVQDDLPRHAAAFVFASPSFGAYAARQLRLTRKIVINGLPEGVLISGVFDNHSLFSATRAKNISFAAKSATQTISLGRNPKAVTLAEFKRKRGFRIDFFMSGVLLSFGTVASIILGSSGYGLYLLALRALSWYRR